MNGFTSAKKTQVKQIIINGKSIDMRIKWDSESQEYACEMKFSSNPRYTKDQEYFTTDWRDAVKTVVNMAYDIV